MTIFEKFKAEMPTNLQLCETAANRILVEQSADAIKAEFSGFIDKMNDQVYQEYLAAQKQVGQKILLNEFSSEDNELFEKMDSFFMSIFQSRKTRAGGAFEYIIRTLFKRLDYPFSEQVEIDGAKPDFVMPSKDYLDERPLDCIIFTAKRTLRERWRQVVTEANKGYAFFLATIDNKVAKSQIEQMAKHKVYMVVPKKIKEENEAYSGVYSVLSFEEFFEHHLDPAIGRWQLS